MAVPVVESVELTPATALAPGIEVSVPASTAEGDKLLAVCWRDTQDTWTPDEAGWTEVEQINGPTSAHPSVAVFVRTATASEPASYIFTGTITARRAAAIARITGHDPDNDFNASASASGASTSIDCPTVTTTINDALVLRIYAANANNVPTPPTGTVHVNETRGGTVSYGFVAQSQATAGATGTATFTQSSSNEYQAITVAIAPTGGGGGGSANGAAAYYYRHLMGS